jgi:hypothetical protein
VRTAIWKKKSRNGFWAWSFYDLVRTGQAVSAFAIHGRHLLPENMNCFHCHRPFCTIKRIVYTKSGY